jgi:hypothetical protein
MSEEASDVIPPFVLDDVHNNPELVARWVNDVEFRRNLLRAESPRDFARQNGYDLSVETSDWLTRLLASRSIEELLGEGLSYVLVPM